MEHIGNSIWVLYTFPMRRRSDLMIYALTAVLLLGAASIWWQGIRPSSFDISPIPTDSGDQDHTNPGQTTGETSGAPPEKAPPIWVHVAGAVQSPGVYSVEEGSRVHQVIELAKPLDDANLDALNLASVLRDSDKIYVPSKEELAPGTNPAAAGGTVQPTGPRYPVNINTAPSAELQWLPGIGPSLAGAIITYRTENGCFQSPEEIKNVSGIGDKTFAKFAHLIVTK